MGHLWFAVISSSLSKLSMAFIAANLCEYRQLRVGAFCYLNHPAIINRWVQKHPGPLTNYLGDTILE